MDSARLSAAKASPMMETINMVSDQHNLNTLFFSLNAVLPETSWREMDALVKYCECNFLFEKNFSF